MYKIYTIFLKIGFVQYCTNGSTDRSFNSKGLVVFVFTVVFDNLLNPYALVPIRYQEVPQT